jgi:transcriptional regulator with XRE-family HTH domain
LPPGVPRKRIDETDIALGARIRLRRNELKLSQGALGEALGITYQQIQKYERGADRVSASMLVKIARQLDCTAASLIGEEPGAIDDSVAPRLAIPGAMALLEIYSKIENPGTRRRLLDLLTDLASEALSKETPPAEPMPWRRGIKK